MLGLLRPILVTSRHQRPVLPAPDQRPTRSGTLPDELLAGANMRLRATAAFAVVIASIRLIVSAVADVDHLFGSAREVTAKLTFFGAAGALGAVVLVLTFMRLRPRRMILIGQVFFVLLVLLLTATESTSPWGERALSRGIPLPVGIILMFPVIVPQPPRDYLIASFLAVGLSVPVSHGVAHLVGIAPPGVEVLALNFMALTVAALIAAITSKVIYQLGKDLGRAQKAGSYQLVAPLGKGGMGEVWRARHGMLAREAAIKLIRSDRSAKGSEEARRRFEHEARVVASLRSQHTIQLYDFGVTDDGALYYAMELLEGMDLDALVRDHGAQPPERVVHFMRQACHSLVEAHERGLVHRDIKPANLFVTKLGRDVDVIKVLDFGLATKPVSETVAEARVTQEGTIIGTPAYMAPEQVLGERDIDGRADLYTLGLVAWYLLTGRDAFQATSTTQVMFAHVNVEATAPSEFSRAPIPPELERVILRCLAKRREDRPQSAEELSDALAKIHFDEPWTRQRALAWWQDVERKAAERVSSPEAVAETRASPELVRPGLGSMATDKTLDA